jgi:predicted phage terminase large subunit-like protein
MASLTESEEDDEDVLPRSHAKTTIVSKAFVLWQIVRQDVHFIAIFSNTDGQSTAILADIRRNLKTNTRLLALFGELLPTTCKDTDHEIVTSTGICVRVAGSGTETRGWTFGPYRPQLIIGDDIESRDTVATTAQRDKLEKWWDADVLPMRDLQKSRVIIVGTILHQDSVLSRKIAKGAYRVHRRKAVIRDATRRDLWEQWDRAWNEGGKAAAKAFYEGHREDMDAGAEVLWPGGMPYVTLMEKKKGEGPFAFQTEYQNDPVPAESVIIQRAWVDDHRPRFMDGDAPYIQDGSEVIPLSDLTVYGSVDAAISKKTQADYSIILTGGLHRQTGRVYLWQLVREHYSSPELIRAILESYDRWDHHQIAIESVAYQAAIKQLVDATLASNGRRIPTVAVIPQADKVLRLSRWQSQFEQRLVRLCDTIPAQAVEELTSFPLAEHDDVPDAISQLLMLATKRPVIRFAVI